jgi:hypothetical protein
MITVMLITTEVAVLLMVQWVKGSAKLQLNCYLAVEIESCSALCSIVSL